MSHDDLFASPFNVGPDRLGGTVYDEALGYEGIFRLAQVSGVTAPGQPGNLGGQFWETARVKSKTPRTWIVTRTPYIPRDAIGGAPWNPAFKPQWGTEATGDRSGGRGRVTWGDGQVDHVSEFDWGRGGTFKVHGSFVKVEVLADLQAAGLGPVAPQLFAGATIVPAQAGGAEPGEAVLTIHTGNFGPARDAVKASLDLSFTPDITDVLTAVAAGAAGNGITLSAIADGAAPAAGIVTVVGTDITWTFKPTVSTNVDFEAAMAGSVAASALVTVTPGAPGVWGGLDAFLMRPLVGGADATPGFVVIPIPDYTKAIRWYQTLDTDVGNAPVPISMGAADDPLFVVGLRQASSAGQFKSTGTTTPIQASDGWWWTINQQARFLSVQNDTAAPGTTQVGLWIEFLLNLGG